MSGTGKHGKKKIFKKIESVTNRVSAVIGILAGAPSVYALFFENIIVMLIFAVFCVIVVLFSFVCYLRMGNIEKYNVSEILRKPLNEKRIREYFTKSLVIKKNKRNLAIIMIVCTIFGTLDGYNYHGKIISQVVKVNGSNLSDNNNQEESTDISTLQQERMGIVYEDIVNISFCLNESKIPSLEEQDAEKVFYVLYLDGENVVINHVDNLMAGDKISGTWKQTEEEEGDIAQASVKEKDFRENVETAKSNKEKRKMEEWQNTVPDICDYKTNVIKTRTDVIDSGKADGKICFLAANDHQYLGDEYKNQNKEYEAVIYYWGQSIIYTEEALMYADIPEELRDKYYNYLKARYKDIADYIDQVWDQIEEGDKEVYREWKDAARKIHAEMP